MAFMLLSTCAMAQQKPTYAVQMLSNNLSACVANAAMLGEENEKLKAQIAELEKEKQEKPK